MISVKLTIDDVVYSSPSSWKDVTFEKLMQNLDEITSKEPPQLIDFINKHNEALSNLSDDLTDKEREEEATKLFVDAWETMPWRLKIGCYWFFALEVGFWCGVDPKLIQKELPKEHLEAAYWALQVQMNPNNSDIDENYTGFEANGIEYLLPKKHMEGATVEEFADAAYFQEAMQGVKGGNWRSMLDVMTVICRPKGETYNDNEAHRNKRKEIFKKLPMYDVINVAFFLLRLNKTLNDNLAIYTAMAEVQVQRQKLLASGTDGRL